MFWTAAEYGTGWFRHIETKVKEEDKGATYAAIIPYFIYVVILTFWELYLVFIVSQVCHDKIETINKGHGLEGKNTNEPAPNTKEHVV